MHVIRIHNTEPKITSTKISALIPSYCDKFDKWKSLFIDKHLSSYKELVGVNDLEFIYNCQGYDESTEPVVLNAIKHAISLNPTWSAQVMFRDPYSMSPVSMSRVRHDCAELSPDANYYIYLDDDVIFHDKVSHKYNSIIKYMNYFPACGAIMSGGFMGGSTMGNKIKIAHRKQWWTNRGLFIRNLLPQTGFLLLPPEHTGHPGGFEELCTMFVILGEGYFMGTSYNNNTYHRSAKMDGTVNHKKQRYEVSEDMHRVDVSFKWLQKLVMDRFGLNHTNDDMHSFLEIQDYIYNHQYKDNCVSTPDAFSTDTEYDVDPDELIESEGGNY